MYIIAIIIIITSRSALSSSFVLQVLVLQHATDLLHDLTSSRVLRFGVVIDVRAAVIIVIG